MGSNSGSVGGVASADDNTVVGNNSDNLLDGVYLLDNRLTLRAVLLRHGVVAQLLEVGRLGRHGVILTEVRPAPRTGGAP